jgi:PQQ-dependent dehydrogenase (s-GDH family)
MTSRRTIRPWGLPWVTTAGILAAAAAGAAALEQNPRNQHNVGPEAFESRVVATGLANPWEITWGPDGYLWVTERTAFRVTRVNPADGTKHVALALDGVYQSVVQDGLLGLALHPDLLAGKGLDYVYVAYTYDRDPGPDVARRIRIRRFTYDARSQSLSAPTDILDDMPAHDDHGAARLVVGPDRTLYFSRGDQGGNWLANFCNPIHSQDLPTSDQVRARNWTAYQGKILRINLDGSIPADNPVIAGVRSHIHSYGYRNPQGLAFGPGGRLYASDHGPSTDDEVDLILAGKNYGWPHVAGFKDDRAYAYANWSASSPTPCSSLKFDSLRPPPSVPQYKESDWTHPDFVPPLATLFSVPPGYDLATLGSSTIAPAGIDIYTATAIPGWANSILVTGMRTGAVYRLKLRPDGQAVEGAPLEYFKKDNRYRDIAINPDGRRIYLATDSEGATANAVGQRTDALADPGAILEFVYTGRQTREGQER